MILIQLIVGNCLTSLYVGFTDAVHHAEYHFAAALFAQFCKIKQRFVCLFAVNALAMLLVLCRGAFVERYIDYVATGHDNVGYVLAVDKVCLSVGVYARRLVQTVQKTCHFVQRFQVVRRLAETAKDNFLVVFVHVFRQLANHVLRRGFFVNPQRNVVHAVVVVTYAKVAVVAATIGKIDVKFVSDVVNVVVHNAE